MERFVKSGGKQVTEDIPEYLSESSSDEEGIFEGTNIKYRNFICKDCSQKKKEFEYQKKTNKLPKDILNLGYIEVSINSKLINVTTPIMVCPFGFNEESKQLTLQFTNVRTDKEMNDFFNFIQKIEFEQMKYLGLNEDNSELYISQIRHDKKGKYDPNLLVKAPFHSNRYDVNIKTKNGTCSITNIFNWSKVKCNIYIDKIWKFNDKYVCKWKVKDITIL